jgi:hypothetical protein
VNTPAACTSRHRRVGRPVRRPQELAGDVPTSVPPLKADFPFPPHPVAPVRTRQDASSARRATQAGRRGTTLRSERRLGGHNQGIIGRPDPPRTVGLSARCGRTRRWPPFGRS